MAQHAIYPPPQPSLWELLADNWLLALILVILIALAIRAFPKE
jgi:hypothetical protein